MGRASKTRWIFDSQRDASLSGKVACILPSPDPKQDIPGTDEYKNDWSCNGSSGICESARNGYSSSDGFNSSDGLKQSNGSDQFNASSVSKWMGVLYLGGA